MGVQETQLIWTYFFVQKNDINGIPNSWFSRSKFHMIPSSLPRLDPSKEHRVFDFGKILHRAKIWLEFVLWVGRENPVIFSGNTAVTVGHSRDCPQHYMKVLSTFWIMDIISWIWMDTPKLNWQTLHIASFGGSHWLCDPKKSCTATSLTCLIQWVRQSWRAWIA